VRHLYGRTGLRGIDEPMMTWDTQMQYRTECGLKLIADHRVADRPAAFRARLLVLPLLAATIAVSGCGKKDRPIPLAAETQMTTIGVNSFLWRAALETVQFMPLAQVDSSGGVIIGDWYQNPAVANERVKVTVAILDGALRADAVQVSASRQTYDGGRWIEAPVRAGTVQRLEEVILERARGMRQAALANR